MGQRLIITEEERTRIAGMYEQSSNAKRVGGPFSVKPNDDVKYYIFRDGSKFYIYMTNASQKEPKLFDGTVWDNKGQGYPNHMEAKQKIDDILKPDGSKPEMSEPEMSEPEMSEQKKGSTP